MRIRLAGLVIALLAHLAVAQSTPRIAGVSAVALYVSDVAKAKAFYGDYLGYEVQSSAGRAVVRISDRQSIELLPDAKPGDRLAYLVFQTNDAEGLRKAFAERGVAVPAPLGAAPVDAARAFRIMDPDGHVLEFRQSGYPIPFTPATSAVSTRMSHAGILVSALPQSIKFYHDVLGFQETWRGSKNAKTLSWVNLKVPDGRDYLEFMLYSQLPPATGRGTQHHICLEVADVKKAWDVLQTRKLPEGCKPPTEMKTGVNGKRQINLFDPEGTRVEIMEPGTFDGKVVPPSTAPAPQGEPLITELLHAKSADGVPAYTGQK